MTQIRPATPGSPKQMTAAEHNTMASAVNYVVENSKERGAVIHNSEITYFTLSTQPTFCEPVVWYNSIRLSLTSVMIFRPTRMSLG